MPPMNAPARQYSNTLFPRSSTPEDISYGADAKRAIVITIGVIFGLVALILILGSIYCRVRRSRSKPLSRQTSDGLFEGVSDDDSGGSMLRGEKDYRNSKDTRLKYRGGQGENEGCCDAFCLRCCGMTRGSWGAIREREVGRYVCDTRVLYRSEGGHNPEVRGSRQPPSGVVQNTGDRGSPGGGDDRVPDRIIPINGPNFVYEYHGKPGSESGSGGGGISRGGVILGDGGAPGDGGDGGRPRGGGAPGANADQGNYYSTPNEYNSYRSTSTHTMSTRILSSNRPGRAAQRRTPASRNRSGSRSRDRGHPSSGVDTGLQQSVRKTRGLGEGKFGPVHLPAMPAPVRGVQKIPKGFGTHTRYRARPDGNQLKFPPRCCAKCPEGLSLPSSVGSDSAISYPDAVHHPLSDSSLGENESREAIYNSDSNSRTTRSYRNEADGSDENPTAYSQSSWRSKNSEIELEHPGSLVSFNPPSSLSRSNNEGMRDSSRCIFKASSSSSSTIQTNTGRNKTWGVDRSISTDSETFSNSHPSRNSTSNSLSSLDSGTYGARSDQTWDSYRSTSNYSATALNLSAHSDATSNCFRSSSSGTAQSHGTWDYRNISSEFATAPSSSTSAVSSSSSSDTLRIHVEIEEGWNTSGATRGGSTTLSARNGSISFPGGTVETWDPRRSISSSGPESVPSIPAEDMCGVSPGSTSSDDTVVYAPVEVTDYHSEIPPRLWTSSAIEGPYSPRDNGSLEYLEVVSVSPPQVEYMVVTVSPSNSSHSSGSEEVMHGLFPPPSKPVSMKTCFMDAIPTLLPLASSQDPSSEFRPVRVSSPTPSESVSTISDNPRNFVTAPSSVCLDTDTDLDTREIVSISTFIPLNPFRSRTLSRRRRHANRHFSIPQIIVTADSALDQMEREVEQQAVIEVEETDEGCDNIRQRPGDEGGAETTSLSVSSVRGRYRATVESVVNDSDITGGVVV